MILDLTNSDDRLPAYARLRDALAARIGSAEWGPEHPIPTEAQLAKTYKVSIGTVRKAVDGLVSEGLLERRQGSGTYVRGPSFDSSLFRFFQFRGADGERSSIPSSTLLLRAVTSAPKEVKEALSTDNVIKIVRLRCLSDQPILYEDIYIPTDRFSGFESIPQDDLGPLLYPIYFEHFQVLVKKAIDDLSFGTADADVAKRLNIISGDPIAIIQRTAFDLNGEAVEWRIARGSTARFNYRSEIS